MDSNNEKASVLKTTREAKGLTLEIVHEATKIPMDALRAIEEGYSVRILSPFYYRGFIKIYSEFLGLDVAEMFKQYGLDKPAVATSSVTVAVKAKSKKSQEPAKLKEPGAPNMFFEQAGEWAAFFFKPKTLSIIFKGVVFLILLFALVKLVGCVAQHLHKKPAHLRRQTVYVPQPKPIDISDDSSQAGAAVPAPAATVIPPLPVPKQEAAPVQSQDSKVELAVRATRNTWIQVKTDGHVVFQMTLSKGSMESWSADNTIELSGKNLERLDVEVNGKHIGSLGGGERRIRKVLINQEGLTVKK